MSTLSLRNPNYNNEAISTSCGIYTTASTSYTTVTNLSVTLTVGGNPVYLGLISDGTTQAYFHHGKGSGNSGFSTALYYKFRETTPSAVTVSEQYLLINHQDTSGGTVIESACAHPLPFHIYKPAAGTYTWDFQVHASLGTHSVNVHDTKMIVWEML